MTGNVTLAPSLGDLHYDTMPANLAPDEVLAYRRGFDRGARTYTRKNGGPGIVHAAGTTAPAVGTAEHRTLVAELAANGRAYRAERHAPAHKAGIASVKSYLRKCGRLERIAEIVDPCAPVKAPRKPRKLAAVPAPVETAKPAESVDVPASDVLAAGVESGRVAIVTVDVPAPATVPAPMPAMTWQARKATRREIAAKLRAAGIRPAGEEWRRACLEAGLTVADEVRA
jgi:hypothetical protein